MLLMMSLLGFATGARTMTPIAVMCWFAYLGLLPQAGWGHWTGYLASAIVFTVFALGEYIGDTLPRTPHRTDAGPLLSRLAFGALVGALAATALEQPIAGGIVFGGTGALAGTYLTHWLRAAGARKLGKDLPVALAESALTLGLTLFAAIGVYGFVVGELAFKAERSMTMF